MNRENKATRLTAPRKAATIIVRRHQATARKMAATTVVETTNDDARLGADIAIENCLRG